MAEKWQLATGAQQFWVCQQDRGATTSYAKWFLLRRGECSSVSKWLDFFGAPRSQQLLCSLVLKPLAHPPIRLEWTDYDHRLVEISCFHWNVLGWSYSFRLFLEGPWTDGKEMEIGTWGSAILSLSARSRWYRIVCKVIPCHVTRMQFCLKMTTHFGAPRTNNCYAL